MSKRYIVAVDSSTKEQNDAFLEFIKVHKLSWWHWLENFWLIIDSREELTVKGIRDELNKMYPRIHNLVIELSEDAKKWAGYGPSSEERTMFKWLKETWGE